MTVIVWDGETLAADGTYDLSTKLAEWSGAPYAYAAMDLEHDAEQAVQSAIKRDVSCGGTIQTWRKP